MNQPANSGGSPLYYLVDARIREFIREPAAIFWVYVFPLLMMVALGVAFRNKPQGKSTIDVQVADGSAAIVEALNADQGFNAEAFEEAECNYRLRTGKTDLVVRPASPSGRRRSILLRSPPVPSTSCAEETSMRRTSGFTAMARAMHSRCC